MAKVEAKWTDYLKETMRMLANPGALLVSVDNQGKPNTMAIGWGTIGIVWGKPIFIVLVRPSRFTYGLIDEAGDFTVNIPYPEMAEEVEFCGTVSGRDHDKFAERNLTPAPAKTVKSPIIAQCAIHYECQVVHKNYVLPQELTEEIISSFYPEGDFHRVYFGEILAVQADDDAKERLAGK